MDDNNLRTLLTKLRKPRSHSWLFETISTSLIESLNKANNFSDYILQNMVTRILTFLRLSRTNNRQIAVKSRINLVLQSCFTNVLAFLNVSQRIRKLDFSILLRASIISVDVKLQNISCVTGCACLWVRLFINGMTGQFKTTLPVESCLQTGKVYVEITIHGESSTVDQFEDNYTTHSFPCFFFCFSLFCFVFFCFCFSVVRILVPKKFFV